MLIILAMKSISGTSYFVFQWLSPLFYILKSFYLLLTARAYDKFVWQNLVRAMIFPIFNRLSLRPFNHPRVQNSRIWIISRIWLFLLFETLFDLSLQYPCVAFFNLAFQIRKNILHVFELIFLKLGIAWKQKLLIFRIHI